MTIVATNGNTICSDTLLDDDGVRSYGPKIFKSKKAIIGIAGDYKHALRFVKWFNDRRKKRPQQGDEFEAIVFTKKYGLEYWDDDLEPQKITTLPYTIGSGWAIAKGAMLFGATPREAVQVAIDHVVSCGGNPEEEELSLDACHSKVGHDNLHDESLQHNLSTTQLHTD